MRLRIPTITLLLLVATISVWSLPKAADRDQDGVADKFDKCKETPTGTKVDKSGCTIVEKKKATGCRPKIEGEIEVLGNGMIGLPAGCFDMGSNDGEEAEKPLHRVCVSAFSMDKYEVTQGEYMRVMGSNPSFFKDCGSNCPVEDVNWYQANAFCEKVGKRLPTEAEWEYAARAKTTTKYNCGDWWRCLDSIAWNFWTSGEYETNQRTHPVGQKKPNEWCLYDMAGNVWEWTNDWFGSEYYRSSPTKDPSGELSGSLRVIRGGGWYDSDVRQSTRGRNLSHF